MPPPNPITALLVSEQADDIRQISTILRAYYPGCRVEAVYTAEEVLEWASKQDWQFIVLDEHLSGRSSAELLPGLRSRAPHSGIFVLTSQSEARNAVQMMHAGADYCLFKHSPAFLTELPLATSMVLEKRNLRTQLDLASRRHQSLVEISSDLIYELDTQGRFRYVSPRALSLLGYSPQEMIGAHYSNIVYGSDLSQAEWRINERRTGNRATNGLRVRLVGKQRPTGQIILDTCEVSATGLYSPEQHFLGTMGVVRTQPRIEDEKEALFKPSPEAASSPHGDSRPEPEPAKPQEVSAGPDPLATILKSTQHLLESLRELQQKARTPSTILDKPIPPPLIPTIPKTPVSLSPLIEDILSSRAEDLQTQDILVEAHLFKELLPVAGQTAQLRQILEALIDKTKQLLRGHGKAKRLRVATRQVEPTGTPPAWTEVELTAEGSDTLKELPGKSTVSIVHLLPPRIAPLLEAFGGTLDSDFLPAGGVRLRLRLPIWEPPPSLLQGPLQPGQTAPEREEAGPFTQIPPQMPLLQKKSQDLSSPERRRWPRVEIQAEASLAINGSVLNGRAQDINMGGLFLALESATPPIENQPVRLSLITEAATLQIPSTVLGFRERIMERQGAIANTIQGVGITFGPLGDIERRVLESLIQGLCDRSISIKIAARLIPQNTGDLLLEVDTAEDETTHLIPIHPSISETEEITWTERRLDTRVKLGIPVQVETCDSSSPFLQCKAQIVNLCVNGAGVRMEGPVSLEGRHLLLRFTIPAAFITSPTQTNGFRRECEVVGDVLWSVPESTFPKEAQSERSVVPSYLGLRFFAINNEEARRQIAEVVGGLLVSPLRIQERRENARLVSDLVETRNVNGHRLVMYHDHPQEPLGPGSPVVVIAPGYGETKKEYIALGYTFAINGFHVLRFDYSNHVGESDGDILHSTLSRMREDLYAILDYVEKTWPASPISVVAASLGARAALKAFTRKHRVSLLVLINCVMDVRATLLSVHQEDLIGTFVQGTRRGEINMLGFNIDADHWLDDAVKEGYADLRTTLKDVEEVLPPVILFSAEEDTWVQRESVEKVQHALHEKLKHSYLIPEALHRLSENPRKAKAVSTQLVAASLAELYPFSPQKDLAEPSQREIGFQNRMERERARAKNQMAKTELVEFWQDYLNHFHYIANVTDFWHLLDHVYRLLGTIGSDTRILDAGCGNGNFGMFLLVNQAYRLRNANHQTTMAASYTGLDFIPGALTQTKLNLNPVAAQLRGQVSTAITSQSPIYTSLCCADLNVPLPFHDNHFDRIVCNLVLGYLQDPLFTLCEFMRVLAPQGRLVLTNLKPHADLSQIYCNFVKVSERPEEIEEARQLLNNAGRIKQGESSGTFRFFNKQEFLMLLINCGAVRPRIYNAFANQAYIAVAEKVAKPYELQDPLPNPPPLEPPLTL